MPSINPPNVQSLASGIPAELKQAFQAVYAAQDKHASDVSRALNSALVVNDSVRVWTPYTAASPLVVPTDWQVPTLSAGWTNYGTTFEPASYRKDATGTVWVRGLVVNASALPLSPFTLPTGFQPSLATLRATSCNAGAGDIHGRLDILGLTDAVPGEVNAVSGSAAAWFSIACSFPCADFSPYVPSCFPVDLLWPFAYPATFVAALARDVSTQATPINAAPSVPDFVMVTQGNRQFVRIRNLPNLPPSKSYSLTVWGW